MRAPVFLVSMLFLCSCRLSLAEMSASVLGLRLLKALRQTDEYVWFDIWTVSLLTVHLDIVFSFHSWIFTLSFLSDSLMRAVSFQVNLSRRPNIRFGCDSLCEMQTVQLSSCICTPMMLCVQTSSLNLALLTLSFLAHTAYSDVFSHRCYLNVFVYFSLVRMATVIVVQLSLRREQ